VLRFSAVAWLAAACTGTIAAPNGGDEGDAGHQPSGDGGLGDGGASGPDAAWDWPDPDDQPPWDAEFGGRLLGATLYGPSLVELAVFAPDAGDVSVVGDWGEEALTRQDSGVWSAMVTVANPIGRRYRFQIDGGPLIADPYSKANRQHRGESLIVDPRFAWTDGDWVRPTRNELVIYEMQLSDFTFDPSSGVSPAKRGRYTGMIDKIDYLRRLGINAVELMPVNETQSDGYGWGYNPALLFAPEAAYASSIDGAQVPELQALIDALHDAGIAVIIDVVYNHIWGQGADNVLHAIDADYYFDFDGDGDIEDDKTPWGYKLATQRPMVRKLIFDNMKYWMDIYHVDGFRLDSTENMHFDAVVDATQALRAAGYGDRYFILEEFSGDHNALVQDTNLDLGTTLLSSWGTGYKYAIWNSVTGGDCGCESLGLYTFFSSGQGWGTADEVVNYYTSHDEGTLTARKGASAAEVRTAATHLLTSLGIPMIWMGEEFQRMHYGNYHPDGSAAAMARENNQVHWEQIEANSDLIDFFGALIRLRVAHPALHSVDGARLDWSTVSWTGAIGYRFTGTPGDHDFVVLVNYTDAAQTYQVDIPEGGTWHLMSDGTRATSAIPGLEQWQLDAGSRDISVGADTAIILMSDYMN